MYFPLYTIKDKIAVEQQIPDNLIIKYLSNEASSQEIEDLYVWLSEDSKNQKILNDWMSTWDQRYENDLNFDARHGLVLLNHKLDTEPEEKQTDVVPLYKWIAVAASLLLIGVFLAFQFNKIDSASEAFVIKSNPFGQKSTFQLPDGSLVTLNAGSTLKFPSVFKDTIRKVELTGEAFFDVVKNPDLPFIVSTGAVNTRVLGTSFNIKAYQFDSVIDVSIVSGKVLVSASKVKTVTLLPNETASYHILSMQLKQHDASVIDRIAWKENKILFEETELVAAAKTLEIWYGVTIKIENDAISNCKITGKFYNENLINVLEAIKTSLNVDYSINQKQIIITGHGCK